MSVVVVSSGQTSTFEIISAGETVEVLSGGMLLAGSVDAGGLVIVSRHAADSGTTFAIGGRELVYGTALATDATRQVVLPGGVAIDTTVRSGGTQIVSRGVPRSAP